MIDKTGTAAARRAGRPRARRCRSSRDARRRARSASPSIRRSRGVPSPRREIPASRGTTESPRARRRWPRDSRPRSSDSSPPRARRRRCPSARVASSPIPRIAGGRCRRGTARWCRGIPGGCRPARRRQPAPTWRRIARRDPKGRDERPARRAGRRDDPRSDRRRDGRCAESRRRSYITQFLPTSSARLRARRRSCPASLRRAG